jgi:hypothetical protein
MAKATIRITEEYIETPAAQTPAKTTNASGSGCFALFLCLALSGGFGVWFFQYVIWPPHVPGTVRSLEEIPGRLKR